MNTTRELAYDLRDGGIWLTARNCTDYGHGTSSWVAAKVWLDPDAMIAVAGRLLALVAVLEHEPAAIERAAAVARDLAAELLAANGST
jgi:hypothetical protein